MITGGGHNCETDDAYYEHLSKAQEHIPNLGEVRFQEILRVTPLWR